MANRGKENPSFPLVILLRRSDYLSIVLARNEVTIVGLYESPEQALTVAVRMGVPSADVDAGGVATAARLLTILGPLAGSFSHVWYGAEVGEHGVRFAHRQTADEFLQLLWTLATAEEAGPLN